MWLAAVVCTPLVANRSFMPIGTPASLPSGLPGGAVGIDFRRGRQRHFRGGDDEGVERRGGGDIGVERLGHFDGLELARGHAFADRGDAEFGEESRFRSLFDHLGHAEEPVLGRRGIGQHRVALAAAGQRIGIDDIVAQAQVVGDHRGHRLDPGDIDLAELLDPGENAVEFGHHRRELAPRSA